jgi:signal transduction histidine kinase
MSLPIAAVQFTAPLQALADAGLLVQVTAAIVLWLLFHVVRRQGNERRYFRLWTTAWGCFALAFAALAFRYRLITGTAFDAYLAHEKSPLVLAMYSIYQISKLCGVGLLIAGILSANGIAHPRWKVWAPLLALYGLVTVLVPPFFERSLALQAIVVVPLFALGAWASLRGPQGDHTLGRSLTGVMLAVLAALWVIYGINYATAFWSPVAGRVFPIFRPLMSLSTLVDTTGMILLGYGQVLILMEDLQQETTEFRSVLSERMAQTQKMEAVGRLVSGVAHELNNPLAAILAFSEELLSDPRTAAEREAIEVIRDQSRRARTIVRDLLAFVGRREERWEAVAVGPLLERVARGVAPEFGRQGAALQLIVDDDLPAIAADRAGIEQVVTNLLTNAAYAAGRGGTVKLVAERTTGSDLRIRVTDSGDGVPDEIRHRVFEPFFTTKPAGQGTGLGLSVSLGIVEQHRGKIEEENVMGGGACFTVILPGGKQPPAPAVPVASAGLASGAAIRPSTVLIIDDESSVRMALRRWFERQGWTVDEAVDGAQALALLLSAPSEETYGVVLCDLRMPGMSGIELHERLADQRPGILSRIIYATGDTASPETAAFLARVERPVLEKPFELAQLALLVEATAGVR